VNVAGIGEAALLVLAAWAASRQAPLATVIIIGFAGATAGADLGYWLGRRGGRPFIERVGARLRLRPEQLAQAELFFARHGDRAVLAAPFVVGVRTWGSMLAGMARMPFARFQVLSAVGILGWAVVVASGGYLVGTNLPLLEAVARYIGVGGVVFLAVIVSALLVAQEHAARRR
jgi:membrane protein DedA with SNARE-associated domain